MKWPLPAPAVPSNATPSPPLAPPTVPPRFTKILGRRRGVIELVLPPSHPGSVPPMFLNVPWAAVELL